MKEDDRKYLLICNVSDGLVAQLNGVVVQLQLAERLGLEPIVYLHRRSFMFGGPNPYFDGDAGPNVWDYYYEPIGPSGEALQALVKAGKVVTLSTASELARLHRWEPESWAMNPYGYFRSVENRADGAYPADWWRMHRDKARPYFSDGPVRFRPRIEEEVRLFVERNFSKNTLGLQLRGSDKFDFGSGPNLGRKVLPEEYFPHIDAYLAAHPDCDRIFVATDQRQWLKTVEAAYPGKVISFSQWSLSDGGDNKFHDAQQKAARGAEVIVDLLLLSHCSYLIKCHAAVGEMAATLNPGLGFIDLNYENQPFRAKSAAARIVLAPTIKAACSMWRALSEGGMALTTVVSIDKDEIMVDPQKPRALNTKTGAKERAPRPPLLSGRFVSDAFRAALQSLGDNCFSYEEIAAGK